MSSSVFASAIIFFCFLYFSLFYTFFILLSSRSLIYSKRWQIFIPHCCTKYPAPSVSPIVPWCVFFLCSPTFYHFSSCCFYSPLLAFSRSPFVAAVMYSVFFIASVLIITVDDFTSYDNPASRQHSINSKADVKLT